MTVAKRKALGRVIALLAAMLLIRAATPVRSPVVSQLTMHWRPGC